MAGKMALTDDEKKTFKKSGLISEIKAKPEESGACQFIPIQNLSTAIGRVIFLEDEIKEVSKIIENVMGDLICVEISWLDNHLKLIKK